MACLLGSRCAMHVKVAVIYASALSTLQCSMHLCLACLNHMSADFGFSCKLVSCSLAQPPVRLSWCGTTAAGERPCQMLNVTMSSMQQRQQVHRAAINLLKA